MARRIKLTRYASNTVNYNNYGAYRLRIEVTDFEGADLDGNIFVYRTVAPSAYTNQNCDVFEAVAGPSQLAMYPAGVADPDQGWPYYRLNYVELDVASTDQATSIWQEIKAQTCALISAMDRLSALQAIEDVWCPAPPEDTSQSSQA